MVNRVSFGSVSIKLPPVEKEDYNKARENYDFILRRINIPYTVSKGSQPSEDGDIFEYTLQSKAIALPLSKMNRFDMTIAEAARVLGLEATTSEEDNKKEIETALPPTEKDIAAEILSTLEDLK